MPSNLYVKHIYKQKIFPRRERCCLGCAVFVVLHFRHIRIALSSAEALRGDSTNSQRFSPNHALHLSSMKVDSLSVTRATPPVSSHRASYLAASFAATVSASKEVYRTADVATHEHSWCPLFSTITPTPPSVCSPDALASKIHPYYFGYVLPRHLHQGLQNILAPGPPAFLIRPLPHLPQGNLSPVVSPGSPLHLSYRHRAAASCLSATVSSPASCLTVWVRSSLSLLVLEIQGLHAGAAYSRKLS